MTMPATLDLTNYYGLCKAGVQAKLLQLNDYFTQSYQVTGNRGDINKGAEYWAIFGLSGFQTVKIDSHSKRVVWAVPFNLYVRYKTESESIPKFEVVRSVIFNWLNADPMLNGTKNVEDVLLTAPGLLLQDLPGDNPNWLIQEMIVNVTQRVGFKF